MYLLIQHIDGDLRYQGSLDHKGAYSGDGDFPQEEVGIKFYEKTMFSPMTLI